MKTTINLTVGDENWTDRLPEAEEISTHVFERVISELKPDFLNGKEQASLNLLLGNDQEIRRLNREFRNIDRPTNILSFANLDDNGFFDILPQTDEVELGDVIIALETMETQSVDQEIDFRNHYVHILIHGILHLLGYDHMEDEERMEMENTETRLLSQFGIADPYEEKA